MEDLRRFHENGLNVNLFFPKWSSTGFPDEHGYSADAGWQAFLRDQPVREGWEATRALLRDSSALPTSIPPVKMMPLPPAVSDTVGQPS